MKWIITFVYLSFLFALFSCASGQKASNSQLANIYSKKGTQDLIDQNYTEALSNLTQAYQYQPDNDEINHNLGMAYYFKKDTSKALEYLKKALTLNPKNTDARMNIATIFMNQKQYDKAEKIYLNSIKNDLTYKKHFRTYYNLSLIKEQQGHITQALEYLRLSLKENSSYCPPNFKLGKLSMDQGSYQQALTYFKRASLGSCQTDPVAHYYQALNHLKLKQFDSAKFKLEEIVSRFPNSNYKDKALKKLTQFQALTNQEERLSY